MHGALCLFCTAAQAAESAALSDRLLRCVSIIRNGQYGLPAADPAVRKESAPSRMTKAIGGTFPNGQRKQFPYSGLFGYGPCKRYLRTKFFCPQLCMGKDIPGRLPPFGMQQADRSAPLFG